MRREATSGNYISEKRGLVGEIEVQRERIEALQAQWKWIIGVLVTLAAAVIQALIRS